MIEVIRGDITKLTDIDAIVNAANGCGIMGAGIAKAIKNSAGDGFLPQVKAIAMATGRPREEGSVYVTPSGDLKKQNIKMVLHAVTMKYPGGGTSYHIVEKCLNEVFSYCVTNEVSSVAVPGLGTGIGNMDPEIVAKRTVQIGKRFASSLRIVIIDINPVFVDVAQKALLV